MGTHESKTSELAFREEKVSDQAQRQGCSAVVLQSFPARTLNHRDSAKAPERRDSGKRLKVPRQVLHDGVVQAIGYASSFGQLPALFGRQCGQNS